MFAIRTPQKSLETTSSLRAVNFVAIVDQNRQQMMSKYSASQEFYMISDIGLAQQNKQCKLKVVVKDLEYDHQEEIMENYYRQKQGLQQIEELTEYYKYYSQKSILHLSEFMPLLHKNRERQKLVEYNRLKHVLSLSQSCELSQQENHQNNTQFSSFNLLSRLNSFRDLNETHQQSFLLKNLKCKLDKYLGSSPNRSIAEIDHNYHFQHKHNFSSPNIQHFPPFLSKNDKLPKKENHRTETATPKTYKKQRNHSCQSLTHYDSKVNKSQARKSLKKKSHLSMQNLNTISLNSPKKNVNNHKEMTFRIYMNTFKKREQNISATQNQIKDKILEIKQKIRKEKENLKKKEPFKSINQLTKGKKIQIDKLTFKKGSKGF